MGGGGACMGCHVSPPQQKILYETLHPHHPPCPRTVLSSQEFVRFTSSELLVWAVGVNTEEGVRVSYVLRENTYPFLALIVLKQSRMVVCDRVEGGVEGVEELVTRLRQAIRENEGELVVERNERWRGREGGRGEREGGGREGGRGREGERGGREGGGRRGGRERAEGGRWGGREMRREGDGEGGRKKDGWVGKKVHVLGNASTEL